MGLVGHHVGRGGTRSLSQAGRRRIRTYLLGNMEIGGGSRVNRNRGPLVRHLTSPASQLKSVHGLGLP